MQANGHVRQSPLLQYNMTYSHNCARVQDFILWIHENILHNDQILDNVIVLGYIGQLMYILCKL